jgi:curved DNA-binding protein CbpA
MILPIAAAIAASVSKAFTPSASTLAMLGVTDQYLFDVNKMGQQAKEFENFLSHGPQLFNAVVMPQSDQSSKNKNAKTRPPPLPHGDDPYALLGFDTLYPPTNFGEIRRAYKETVKMYHPDAILGPDASAEEREAASQDFARINSAFEHLKLKEDERALEGTYEVYFDDDREKNCARASGSTYPNHAYQVDYERIKEVAEYRKRNPRKKMWYEEEHYYQPRHNGFGRVESQQQQRERWWAQQDSVYEYAKATNSYREAPSRRNYSARPKEGFPYKERLGNERHIFDEPRFSSKQYEYYKTERGGAEYDRFREKWWTKGHNEYESHFNGEFGP